MIKPITPHEVSKVKANIIPPEVIQVFNELIAANWDGSSSRVKQDDAAQMIADRLGETLHENPRCRRAVAFERKYLDVESIYESAGWEVEYYKPAYNEEGSAYFIFSLP